MPVPTASHAIVNGHFRLPGRRGCRADAAAWPGRRYRPVAVRRDALVSVTVSAADDLAEEPGETIARRFWTDTSRALDLPTEPQPPGRIVKERRATFAQTPDGGPASGRKDGMAQPVPRRRLDRDRAAGDDRRRHPLG